MQHFFLCLLPTAHSRSESFAYVHVHVFQKRIVRAKALKFVGLAFIMFGQNIRSVRKANRGHLQHLGTSTLRLLRSVKFIQIPR